MKDKLTRTYRADKTPGGQWTVFRVITSRTGPWYWGKYIRSEKVIGHCSNLRRIDDVISKDIVEQSPEKIIKSNHYDSMGRSTDYHGY